ncbi:MAG: hypothetical protein J4F38_12855 [Pseudomonadales bacterium]|nr:hypothetical protein [Pseudomonadales bacterium]
MAGFFPDIDARNVAVRWTPLVVRPIASGPECFVAAIAANARTGEVGCHRLVDGRRMRTLFHDGASRLGAVVDASVASLRNHLESRLELDGWQSPFDGVYLGNGSTVYVRRFRDAFEMAARTCAVFGEPGLLDGAHDEGLPESDPWKAPVADVLRELRPELSNSVDAQLALATTEHTITFTFFGVNLAANFVLLNPQRLTTSLREARAHLWNLSLVADAPDLLFRPSRLELLTGVRSEDERIPGVIEELAFEGGFRRVNVTRVESTEQAAEQIAAKAA